MIDFIDTIQKGKIGEDIFKEDFLNFLDIKYEDVTGCQSFQVIDTDYIAKIGMFEIKLTYKDDNKIIIEDYTNCNDKLCKISKGWFYKSKADILCFISRKTRTMILIPFTENFKKHYEIIKESHKLYRNRISYDSNTGNKWQSAFRVIGLESISGYYSKYRREYL